MATVQTLIRKFKHGDRVLNDPNPDWNTKQVMDFYSADFPELVNANLEGPSIEGNEMIYSINTKTGTKG